MAPASEILLLFRLRSCSVAFVSSPSATMLMAVSAVLHLSVSLVSLHLNVTHITVSKSTIDGSVGQIQVTESRMKREIESYRGRSGSAEDVPAQIELLQLLPLDGSSQHCDGHRHVPVKQTGSELQCAFDRTPCERQCLLGVSR